MSPASPKADSANSKRGMSIWLNAFCGSIVLAWISMAALASFAQIVLIRGHGSGAWKMIASLSNPPIKLWGILLVPYFGLLEMLIRRGRPQRLMVLYVTIAVVVC